VTWLGFCITSGAAALIVTEHPLAAGIVVLVAGLFDMLDGALARVTNRVTRFGGILDSTLDRVSEAVLLLGLLAVFARDGEVAESLLVGFALLGSLMVSYIRARMEGMGIECRAGLFTRPERVIVLALGLLLSGFDYALITALSVITFFSYFTAGQRLIYAWRQTRN
jgi:CDP-diacylglycerol--glycerol-3-phosphate 3-phosphatidyltransferase